MDPSFQHIVVIGASSGGVAALEQIAQALPNAFPAPVLAVLHVGRSSQLPAVLARVAHMPVLHPFDAETLYPGRIYVARPAQHMRVERGRVRIAADAVDEHKPSSVDELFQSAAVAYGRSVIGVVLTGYLSDGAEGLRAIKERGGTTIVQDPRDAAVPDMPLAAAARTTVDYRCTLDDLGPLLCGLVTRDGGHGR